MSVEAGWILARSRGVESILLDSTLKTLIECARGRDPGGLCQSVPEQDCRLVRVRHGPTILLGGSSWPDFDASGNDSIDGDEV